MVMPMGFLRDYYRIMKGLLKDFQGILNRFLRDSSGILTGFSKNCHGHGHENGHDHAPGHTHGIHKGFLNDSQRILKGLLNTPLIIFENPL